jgi:shikimate 5-dehydrogenase
MVVARKETPLISSAIAAGAKLAIPGQEMWLRQGTLQLEAITGLRVATADLRGILNG